MRLFLAALLVYGLGLFGLVSMAHADTVQAVPDWLQTLVSSAEALPTIGPLLVKILGYGSLVITILTALCAFVILTCRTLSSVAQFAKLGAVADKIQAFENGNIMYYLKYISAFNAPVSVPAAPAAVIAAAAPAAAIVAPVAAPAVPTSAPAAPVVAASSSSAPAADQPKV